MNDTAAVFATVSLAALAALVALVVLVPADGGTSALAAAATIVRDATPVLVVACGIFAAVACATVRFVAREPEDQ